MEFQFTPFVTPLLAAGLVTATLAGYAWTRRTLPGATPFTVMMAAVTLWSVANSLEIMGTDLPTKLLWANVQYFSFVVIPAAWLLTAIEFTGDEAWMTRPRLAALCVMPIITIALVFTNDMHALMRYDVRLVNDGAVSAIAKRYGPWFWVHTTYSYALFVSSAVLLYRMLRRTPALHRGQPTVLLAGMFLPLSANAIYLLGVRVPGQLDLTPVFFGVGGILVAWAIFQYGLFDLIPVARDRVIEWMADGIMVLDGMGRIVSLNPAAERILALPASRGIGRNAARVFHSWPDFAALCAGSGATTVDLSTGGKVLPRHYEVFASTLTDQRGRPVGRAITIHDSTKRRDTELALRESEATYRNSVDSLPLALYEADLSGRLTFGNRSGVEMFGYEWTDFESGLNVFDLIAPDDRALAGQIMAGVIAGERSRLREYTALKKDGTTFPVIISAERIVRGDTPIGMKGFVLDISFRRQAEEAVRNSEERYRTLAEAAQDIIFISDLSGTLQYVNSFAATQRQCATDDLIGKPLTALLAWDTTESRAETIKRVAESRTPSYFEHHAALNGRDVWLYTCLAPLKNDTGEVASVMGISRDITELVQMREELLALSLNDEMTGLNNRRGFLALAQQHVKLAERNREDFSILLADVDGLKAINDTYGHEEGDRALIAVARILKATCRGSDVVARLGGDEFAVLAAHASPSAAELLARRTLQALEADNARMARPYSLSMSVGLVHGRDNSSSSINELLAKSDRLMYEEKRRKRAGQASGTPASPMTPGTTT